MLEKDFMGLQDRELKYKANIVSKDDMDKFEEEEIKKIRLVLIK